MTPQDRRGVVAVFWDLDNFSPIRDPIGMLTKIRQLAGAHGKVKYMNAYLGHRPGRKSETSMLKALKASDVAVYICPKLVRKPTIHHSMEEDIAFHVACDHPETTAVVFVTGKRDFTYLAQTLRRRCVRVVVLAQNSGGDIVQANADKYWPLKATKAPQQKAGEKKKVQKKKGPKGEYSWRSLKARKQQSQGKGK